MHICASNNFLEACKILITLKADVNYPANNGYTPLHQAIRGNHKEMVSLLIEHGAKVVNDLIYAEPLGKTIENIEV